MERRSVMEGNQRLANALSHRYRLLGELGRGGTATVYLAQDLRHARQVAVKVLRPELVSRGSVERFLREIHFVAKLQHPHVLPLLDSGEADGSLFFVMPFVEGETLRSKLLREGRLPVPEILRILADVVDAVAHAHARGIVHRDLKPENIMLSGRHALVTDFGVAKALSVAGEGAATLTQGVAIGTPAYMAPEQATADPSLDDRVDIYAIGILAYEMLAGRPPFTAGTASEILTAHVVLTPEPISSHRADTPPALASVLHRCLAKKPEDRYQEASTLLEALDPCVTPGRGTPPARSGTTRRSAFRLGITAALALVVAAGSFAVLSSRSAPADAGSHRQITFRGDILESAISPDGSFLAYVSPIGDRNRIGLLDLRGGTDLTLGEGVRIGRPEWSPDGGEIRFSRLEGSADEIMAVPRLGGPARTIARERLGMVSPDGRRVSVLGTIGGRLRILNVDGSDSTIIPLPLGDHWVGGHSWSPRGNLIAVRTRSPTSDDNRFLIVNLFTKRVEEIHRDTARLSEPAWSPDGSALFYLRSSAGTVSLWRLPIAPTGAPRGEPRRVISGLADTEITELTSARLTMTGDGRRIVYQGVEERSNLASLSLAGPADRRHPVPLTSGTANHVFARFSPDGRLIAFVRDERDQAVVVVQAVDGGPARPLARFRRAAEVSWSPDGTMIAVAARRPGETRYSVVILPLDGGAPKTFARGVSSSSLDWGADGRIVYMRHRNLQMGLLDPRTGADTLIPFADPVGWRLSPRLSPDGRTVVHGWNRLTGRTLLSVESIDGGGARKIEDIGWRALRFSADGREVYAVRHGLNLEAFEVAAVPLDGGPTRALATPPPGSYALDVSPDGRRLLLSLAQRRADAWEVTLPSLP